MRKRGFYILILMLLLVLTIFTMGAIAADVYVSGTEDPGWYDATHVATINESINNASNGNEVYIYDGEYTCELLDGWNVSKELHFIGESKEGVLCRTYEGQLWNITADNVTIENISMYSNASGVSTFVIQQGGNFTLQNSFLEANYTSIFMYGLNFNITNLNNISLTGHITEGLMFLQYSDNVTIENVTCNATADYGIHILGNNTLIQDCSFTGAIDDELLHFEDYLNDTIIRGNYLQNSEYGIRLASDNYHDVLIYNNYFSNNSEHMYGGLGSASYNISKTLGTNIISGPYLGGNYWDNYTGVDTNSDRLGDTLNPVYGDELPLTSATVVYVDDNANPIWYDREHVATMPEAINNVSVGGTIYVWDGTYNNSNIQVNKSLSIIGNTSANVTIDGENAGNSGDDYLLRIDANNVTISGFTFKQVGRYYIPIVWVGCNAIFINNTNNLTIHDCIFDGSVNYMRNAISSYSHSENYYDRFVGNVSIHNNTFIGGNEEWYVSVYLDADREGNIVENITIRENNMTGDDMWYPIEIYGDNYNDNKTCGNINIINNTFNKSSSYTIITIQDLSNIVIKKNEHFGLEMDAVDNLQYTNNIINGSTTYYSLLGYLSNSTIENNIFTNVSSNTIDIDITGSVIIRNNTFSSIQDYTDCIYVEDYFWGCNYSLKIENNNFTGGDYAIINDIGTSSNEEKSHYFYVANNTFTNVSGYAIYMYEETFDAFIMNNTFTDGVHDGITFSYESYNDTLVERNTFENCTHGILFDDYVTNITIHECIFENNTKGIDISSESDDILIYNNIFRNNTQHVDDNSNSGNVTYNISKTLGTNIIGGPYLGGNYWDNYTGVDISGDNLGDTLTPFLGDFHPLTSYGRVGINVYKESDPSIEITNYTILVTNETGAITYYQEDCSNPFSVFLAYLPTNESVGIQISAEGYYARTHYYNYSSMDTNTYNLSFYLPPNPIGGGEYGDDDYIWPSTSGRVLRGTSKYISNPAVDLEITLLCDIELEDIYSIKMVNTSPYIQYVDVPNNKFTIDDNVITVDSSYLDDNSTLVIVQYYCPNTEEYGQYYSITVSGPKSQYGSLQEIEDALLICKRYIDETDEWETMYRVYTDASGSYGMYLIPSTYYKFDIIADDYATSIGNDYIPAEDEITHVFILEPSGTPIDICTFDSFLNVNLTQTNSGIIWCNYSKVLDSSVLNWCNVSVYYIRNQTMILTDNDTGPFEGASLDFEPSTSSGYVIRIKYNISGMNMCNGIYSDSFMSYSIDNIGNSTDIEDIIEDVIGDSPFKNVDLTVVVPWIYLIVFFLALFVATTFSKQNGFVGMMGAGFVLLLAGAGITGLGILYTEYIYQGASLLTVGGLLIALGIVGSLGGVERR